LATPNVGEPVSLAQELGHPKSLPFRLAITGICFVYKHSTAFLSLLGLSLLLMTGFQVKLAVGSISFSSSVRFIATVKQKEDSVSTCILALALDLERNV
jgi:hypothetical protein